MSEDKAITHWAAAVGIWERSSGRCVYKSPQQAAQWPYGICVSNVRRFSEGTARATIRFPDEIAEGRLLFGYRSPTDPYVTIGLGGHEYEHAVYQYRHPFGWHAVAGVGSKQNLVAD